MIRTIRLSLSLLPSPLDQGSYGCLLSTTNDIGTELFTKQDQLWLINEEHFITGSQESIFIQPVKINLHSQALIIAYNTKCNLVSVQKGSVKFLISRNRRC